MVRHVSQPPFLAQPGGRQQVGIVATVCENAEPRYQNPTQEKELPERNQIGQWHEENGPRSVSKHSGSTTPGRLIDTLNNESPGILWDMPTLSVQFDIGDIARFSTSSSPVQPFVENQDIYLESKAKPSQESILFCRLDSKNILPRTRLIWLTTQKDMNLRRLPAPSLRNGLKERKCSLPYQDLRGLKWRTQKKKHQCAPSTCLRKEGGIPPVQQKNVWDATEGTRPAW